MSNQAPEHVQNVEVESPDPFGFAGMLGGMLGGLDLGALLPDPAALAAAGAEPIVAKLDELLCAVQAQAGAIEMLCQILGPIGQLAEHPAVAAMLAGKSPARAATKRGTRT